MKKIIIILSALLLLASCQKESHVPAPEETVVTYTVQTPVEFEVKSGENGAGSEINALWYGVYHKKGDGSYVYIPEVSDFVEEITDPLNIKVSIKLFKEQEYRLVFVAQHCISSVQRNLSYVYTITDDGVMSVNQNAPITSGDQLEAFVYVDDVELLIGNEVKDITLNRIVSQVNICTSSETLPEKLNVSVSGTPESYNLFTGSFSEKTVDLAFENLNVPGDDMTVSNNSYKRLTTLYFLGNNKIDITVSDAADNENSTSISQIDNKVNYKTNIAGNILPENKTI